MHRPQGNGQVVSMIRSTVDTQPQIIIVACWITLRRSADGAWGNSSVHDNKGAKNTLPTFIGHINPLRYRSYYYDAETGSCYNAETGSCYNKLYWCCRCFSNIWRNFDDSCIRN